MASQKTPSVPGDLGPTFVKIFGPVFWGSLGLDLFSPWTPSDPLYVLDSLAGVSILQGYIYFTRYNDKLLIRAVAGLMLVLNLLSTALICQSVYYYILPDYGSLAPLGAVTSEMNVDCLISSAIAFISQMFFLYQLMVVGKSRATAAPILNALIVVFGIISLGGGVGCVVVMFKHPQFIFMNRSHAFSILAGIHKAFGAAADVVATIAMFIFLKSADTGIHQTSSLLRF
ncbi:hypothetical protein B0H14DRAFT_3150949 [Mycena olivaceomarginata]|nr:hypothetical protein B0H14DRAFT_3150949 [Mycena olivaceomarginata]